MLISTEYSGLWYTLFYQLAFVATLILFLIVCWRSKKPLTTNLLIAISGATFAIVGSKLGTFTWSDWQHLWIDQTLPIAMGKTTVGAFIFGSFGLVLAKRFLKYPFSILDTLAFVIPIALIFQRIGCLLGGCCFGRPTTLPLGIRYGKDMPICQYHYMEGYIDYPTALSFPVHPVPIYFILAAILTLLLLFRFKRHFKSQGSLFLMTISSLFIFRFLIEFARDPITNHNLSAFFLGLKLIQWLLLLLLTINGSLIFLNERKGKARVAPNFIHEQPFLRTLFFTTIPLTLLTLGSNWFNPVELSVLRIAILLLFGLLLWTAFKKLTIPRFRFVTTGLMVMAVILMAQYPANNDQEKERIKTKDSQNIGIISGDNFQRKKTQTFTFGYLGRSINFDYVGNESCFSAGTLHEVGPNFSSVGLDYNHMWYKYSNVGLGFGFGGHYTTFKTRTNGGPPIRNNLGGLTGYYQMEIKEVVGFKTGLNLGDFPVINGDNFSSPILPLLYLRFGPPDQFFLDAGLGNDLPFGFTASFFQMGGGIGLRAFDIDNSSRLRFGVTKIADKNALYFSGDIYVKQWILSPTIRVSESASPNFGLKLGVNFGDY